MQYASSTGWRLNFGQLARSIAHIVDASWTAYVRHRGRVNAIAELRSMDDHTLADMGVARCGIESAIRSADSDPTLRHRQEPSPL
ncbi:hypothetical protein BH10PSE10_BH10PSE10_18630 [soil metagenome]